MKQILKKRKLLEIYRKENRQQNINWKQLIRKLNRKRIRNLLSNFLTGALVDFVFFVAFSTASVFSSSTGGGSGDMRRRYSWKASCVDVSQNIRCAAAILDIMIQWIPRLLQLASHQGPAQPLLWFAPVNNDPNFSRIYSKVDQVRMVIKWSGCSNWI